jgi:copper chaperone
METITLKISGMTCQGCVRSVTRVLSEVKGVRAARVSLERGEAQVDFDLASVDMQALKHAVEEAGYQVIS